jgi:hypothetical protein
MRRLSVALLVVGAVAAGLWRWQAAQSSGGAPARVRVWSQPEVSAGEAEAIAREFGAVRREVDSDFPPHVQPMITLRFYASHIAFAAALYRLEGVWPERRGDNVGNIAGDVLPLGPHPGLLRHNLAHVYTEWVLDRLTGNDVDRQPAPAWLYDGIAEYEADRRAAAVPCRLNGGYVVPLGQISAPKDWWRVRGGIYQGLEYCEAEDAAARIVKRVDWARITAILSEHPSWERFAGDVGASVSWRIGLRPRSERRVEGSPDPPTLSLHAIG